MHWRPPGDCAAIMATRHAERAIRQQSKRRFHSMRPKVSSWLVLGICLAALAAVVLFELI